MQRLVTAWQVFWCACGVACQLPYAFVHVVLTQWPIHYGDSIQVTVKIDFVGPKKSGFGWRTLLWVPTKLKLTVVSP